MDVFSSRLHRLSTGGSGRFNWFGILSEVALFFSDSVAKFTYRGSNCFDCDSGSITKGWSVFNIE